MRITRLGGIALTDSTGGANLYAADKIETLFQADGAIDPGQNCMLDTAADSAGTLVVVTSTTAVVRDNLSVGIYEGDGGTGADATLSGTSGKSAVAGDNIWVTSYGPATAISSAAVALGAALSSDATTAGRIKTVTAAVAPGVTPYYVALTAAASAGVAFKVFCRCM